MKIYVMRHGTTVWNEKGITQGHSQNRLSYDGKLLAEDTAKKFMNVKFDIIFASPLMRTMQTANIMNKYHNIKILKDERLIEINQGIFTGRHASSLTENEKSLKAVRSKDCGMESFQEVYARLKIFIDDIKNTYANKTPIILPLIPIYHLNKK